MPSFRIFIAALVSLLWYLPQFGHIQDLTARFFNSSFLYPHSEQICELAKNLSTFINLLPISSNLYLRNVVNFPHPLSHTDFPKFQEPDAEFFHRQRDRLVRFGRRSCRQDPLRTWT